MTDEDLIGYLFDLLDPEERVVVLARVQAEPGLAKRLEQIRSTVTPLLAAAEAERDELPEAQPGLAVRAISRVAQYVVEHEPRKTEPGTTPRDIATLLKEMGTDPPVDGEFEPSGVAKAPPPSDGPDLRTVSGRFRVDLFVAAGIALLGLGLILSGIAKARHQNRVVACQNSLRTLHTGLVDYANNDPQGRYPQIGTGNNPTADTFVASLTDRGHLPSGYRPGCPATSNIAIYSYTLGFHGPNGELVGLRYPTNSSEGAEHDLMPIAADFPASSVAPGAGPVSPHGGGMNVLFVGGNVRLTTSPHIGPHGDDIYRNVYGRVAAGAHSSDAVLGRPGDRP